MGHRYTISDGKLILRLAEACEGGFVVSSPLDPGLWTQARTVAEAFENARDALKALAAARRKPLHRLGPSMAAGKNAGKKEAYKGDAHGAGAGRRRKPAGSGATWSNTCVVTVASSITTAPATTCGPTRAS